MSLDPTVDSPSTEESRSGARRPRVLLHAVTAFLALVGLADATYLTIEHLTGQSVRCTLIAGCSEVLSSPYATMRGIPLALVGAAAYFAVFSLATLAAFGYRGAGPLLTAVVAIMFAVTLWLVYLQAFVIRAFCQYCLFSAAITILLTVITLIGWRRERRKL